MIVAFEQALMQITGDAPPPCEYILVAIPTLNEECALPKVIEVLLTDKLACHCRFVIVDGGSDDATRQIAKEFGVEVIHNPQRNQAAAINLAVKLTACCPEFSILVRIDAHAKYPTDFLSTVVSTMIEEQVSSVVVPMETLGGNRVQDAASRLFNSWLGHGGSPHRSGQFRGRVGHGHHAAIRLDAFREIGGYDEEYLANEDADFDFRLTAAGHEIFLESRAMIGYFPRNSLAGFWKQMYRNGKYRIRNAFKNQRWLATRQLLPIAVAPVVLLGLLLTLASPALGFIVLAAYLAPTLIMSLLISLPLERQTLLLWPHVFAVAVTSHVAFSTGAVISFALSSSKLVKQWFVKE